MKHLHEEDHNLFDSTAVDIEDMDIQYGLDPMELLIHLEELKRVIEASMLTEQHVRFKRAPQSKV